MVAFAESVFNLTANTERSFVVVDRPSSVTKVKTGVADASEVSALASLVADLAADAESLLVIANGFPCVAEAGVGGP